MGGTVNGWDALGKLFDNLKYILLFAALVLVGYGLLNLDAVLAFGAKAIDMVKAAK